jgi:hypothetical protein
MDTKRSKISICFQKDKLALKNKNIQKSSRGKTIPWDSDITRRNFLKILNYLKFFLQERTHFIAYKSSTAQNPPRLLPEAEVRNNRITGKYYMKYNT